MKWFRSGMLLVGCLIICLTIRSLTSQENWLLLGLSWFAYPFLLVLESILEELKKLNKER